MNTKIAICEKSFNSVRKPLTCVQWLFRHTGTTVLSYTNIFRALDVTNYNNYSKENLMGIY